MRAARGQGPGAVALGVRRIPLRQRVAYGTIPAKDVPYRLSLRAGGGSGADKGVTVVQQGLAVRRMGAQYHHRWHLPLGCSLSSHQSCAGGALRDTTPREGRALFF
jgi:hypothetical protein